MPRRAKFEKISITSCVEQWDNDPLNQGKPTRIAAKELKLTAQQVQSARAALKKKCKKEISGLNPLQEKDIIAVSKIGIATVERILKLLKSL
jgi:hypothetical protein